MEPVINALGQRLQVGSMVRCPNTPMFIGEIKEFKLCSDGFCIREKCQATVDFRNLVTGIEVLSISRYIDYLQPVSALELLGMQA